MSRSKWKAPAAQFIKSKSRVILPSDVASSISVFNGKTPITLKFLNLWLGIVSVSFIWLINSLFQRKKLMSVANVNYLYNNHQFLKVFNFVSFFFPNKLFLVHSISIEQSLGGVIIVVVKIFLYAVFF